MSNTCLHLYIRPLECLEHGVKCEEAVCIDCGASALPNNKKETANV